MLDKKIIRITQELGTADFIVHHIHAFTIHVTLLILSKGVLYARNSRFVSDKLELGFTLLIPVMGQVEVVHVKYHLYFILQPKVAGHNRWHTCSIHHKWW